MKDHFSAGAGDYARFRPGYPEALARFLAASCPAHQMAWDCGTGNGQLALQLAGHFSQVFATDMSAAQIDQAVPNPKVRYQVAPAEATPFEDRQFDLITVAQAIHWFDFTAFYREVYRTLKDDGLFAVAGYSLPVIHPEVDALIARFYREIVGAYWDPERQYIDEQYQTIPFPFDELEVPRLEQIYQWSPEALMGYLGTWSAVQHYRNATGTDPLVLIDDTLRAAWGNAAERRVSFPVLLRAGRKHRISAESAYF